MSRKPTAVRRTSASPRIVSPTEAVGAIDSGDQIFLHGAAATPSILLDALVARADELQDVKIVGLHIEGPGPHMAPEMAGHFRHRALFIGPNARQAVNDGRADYIPVFLSDIPKLFVKRLLPLDAAFINVSPPDEHGFCSLGTSVEAALAAVQAARRVVAQFNKAMPRTLGDSFLHVSQIDLATEVDIPPYELAPAQIGLVERRIGAHVAELVPDGATIQMGIGQIPAAIGEALREKVDLGVHTEMVTDVVVDLVEAGAVTGARKEINRGKIVSTFVLGSDRLYRFVHDNPMVEMRPVDYTNDTAVIRRFRRMTAINSAIEVDLTGQVCADSIGTRLYSGVGGQMDFVRGAALADEGEAIIALPSTAAGGTVSRIVPFLNEGAGVTTTRAHVRTVVTEWGVAELFGKSIAGRAKALIAHRPSCLPRRVDREGTPAARSLAPCSGRDPRPHGFEVAREEPTPDTGADHRTDDRVQSEVIPSSDDPEPKCDDRVGEVLVHDAEGPIPRGNKKGEHHERAHGCPEASQKAQDQAYPDPQLAKYDEEVDHPHGAGILG
jgi:4-hydroxybutyrate CoA-transferase